MLLALTFLVMMLSNIQCYEYQNHRYPIITATALGRTHLLRNKLFITLLCGLLFGILAIGFDFWKLYKFYGLTHMDASITSLTQFSFLPADMTILQFLILTWAGKLLAITCTIFILFALSSILRHQMYVIIFLVFLLLVPLLLSLMGLSFLNGISMAPLIHCAKFIKDGHILQSLFTSLLYGTIGCYSLYQSFKLTKNR